MGFLVVLGIVVVVICLGFNGISTSDTSCKALPSFKLCLRFNSTSSSEELPAVSVDEYEFKLVAILRC